MIIPPRLGILEIIYPGMMRHDWRWRDVWFFGIILICSLLVWATLVSISDFNLRRESNYAALWSGMLLLLIALHAFDGSAENKSAAPRVARAWSVISLVMILLSFDEIASLHERLPADTHLQYWLWVLPFAAGFAGMAVYSLLVLYRTERYRHSAILICLGFLLFGLVAVQEEIEWRLDWSAHMKPIRGAIEEGTELLGMIFVLSASMLNTRSPSPVLEAVRAWRSPVLVLGLVTAPLIALGTVSLPTNRWSHGLPAEWPPAAIFLLAACAAIRPSLSGTRKWDLHGWGLTAICLIGCATTTFNVGSRTSFGLLGGVSAVAVLIWILDSRYALRSYAPAALFLATSLGIAWFLSDIVVARYCVLTYVALGLYYVNSAQPRSARTSSQ